MTMAYVGISACSCIRAVTVDEPEYAAQVRKDVAAFMRKGDTIERMSVEDVRLKFCTFPHSRSRTLKRVVCPHPNACPDRLKEAL